MEKVDPIGPWKMEFLVAQLSSIILNIARSVWKEKGSKPKMSKTEDFMPQILSGGKPIVKKQSAENMKQTLLAIFTPLVKRGEKAKKKRARKRVRLGKRGK